MIFAIFLCGYFSIYLPLNDSKEIEIKKYTNIELSSELIHKRAFYFQSFKDIFDVIFCEN